MRKRSKIWGRISGAMPQPSSATLMRPGVRLPPEDTWTAPLRRVLDGVGEEV